MGSDSFKDHLGSRCEDCVTGNGLLRSYLESKWNYAKGGRRQKKQKKVIVLHFPTGRTFEDHQTGKKYICRLTKG